MPSKTTVEVNAALAWILGQLQQQSTWKGIILLLTSAGIYLKPDQIAAITTAGLAIVGLVNVFHNETAAADAAVQRAQQATATEPTKP